MKIVIWGLGYVGTVSTACLGPVGTRSQRRRPNLTKVHAVASRRSVTKEPGLDRLISQAVAAEHLDATQNGATPCALRGRFPYMRRLRARSMAVQCWCIFERSGFKI